MCILALLAWAAPALATDFSDPTWPCVQRKVERLSPGLMWAPPIDPEFAPTSEEMRHDIDELAETLSLRRVDLDAATPQIKAFAARYQGDPQILGTVFLKVFHNLSERRSRIIKGIEKFSLGQIALADKIDGIRTEMDRLVAAQDPDFDKIDVLEETLDWDQVIYTDRQRSIRYLCETPAILERRLYRVAQLLQAELRAED